MVTAPEVFRISRDQDFDYQFNLQAALSNFESKLEKDSKKMQKKQAAAEAGQAEAAPVNLQQQVEQAATATAGKKVQLVQKQLDSLEQEMQQLKQQLGQGSKGQRKKQQQPTFCEVAAGAVAGPKAAAGAAADNRGSSGGSGGKKKKPGKGKNNHQQPQQPAAAKPAAQQGRQEDALRTFWKFTANNASYIQMTKDWIQSAYRMQYIVNSCAYPAPGTYLRHSFEYQPAASAACAASSAASLAGPAGTAAISLADMQKYVRTWYKFCQNAPAKPVTCVFGADLGLGKELYPNNTPNMAFGGSLDFKSQADMETFWKWLFVLPEYKELNKNNKVASRIQYAAKF